MKKNNREEWEEKFDAFENKYRLAGLYIMKAVLVGVVLGLLLIYFGVSVGSAALSYSAGTNTITATGYTEATPCTFLDIYNADVAGAWGVVSRQCSNQYCFDAKLAIGDGSTATWFADENQHVIFSDGIADHWVNIINVLANGHFRIGKCLNATLKTCTDGCSIISLEDTKFPVLISGNAVGEGDIEIYGCNFMSPNHVGICHTHANSLKNYWSSYLNFIVQYYSSGSWNTHRVNIVGVTNDGVLNYPKGSVNDLVVTNGYSGLYGFGFTAKNVQLYDNTYALWTPAAETDDVYLINCVADSWTFLIGAAGLDAYRQYEFTLTVQNSDGIPLSGATVEIWNRTDTLVVDTTTNAGGDISTETLNYSYYNRAGGNAPYMKTPHTIRISKLGYETYEMTWTLDQETEWIIALENVSRDLVSPPERVSEKEEYIEMGILGGCLFGVVLVLLLRRKK